MGPHCFVISQVVERLFSVRLEYFPLLGSAVVHDFPAVGEFPRDIMIFRKSFCGKLPENAGSQPGEVTVMPVLNQPFQMTGGAEKVVRA